MPDSEYMEYMDIWIIWKDGYAYAVFSNDGDATGAIRINVP